MSLHHNPRIVTDGLVFAYDMDNAAKSFKGKPTTNIITITDLDTGWSQQYNTSIQWNDYKPPHGVNSQVVSFIDADGNGSGYWYSYGDYAPQQPSTTYTISVYARTIGSDWSVRAYTADNSEVGRQYTNTLTVPGDGKWHRLEFNSITTPSNTESDSLSFSFTTIPAGQRCWLCAPQMEEGTFATPFVNGTRSNTQALLDISKSKNTVTATSLTYNSDGTFEFDNSSSNYVDLPNDIGVTGNNVSAFAWFKRNGSPSGGYHIICGGQELEISIPDSNGAIRVGILSGGTRYVSNHGSGLLDGNWHHIGFTSDGTTKTAYIDGESVGTQSISGTLSSSFSNRRLGRFGSSNTYYANANISLYQIYNRALTAAEIKQNFNATRGRFGI